LDAAEDDLAGSMDFPAGGFARFRIRNRDDWSRAILSLSGMFPARMGDIGEARR
jgi:hypothetical protein